MWKTLTRKMKDSGIEWIGEIPENWEVVQVKHLFEIGRGRVISKEELKFDSQTGYPVYSSQTKNDGVLGFIGTYDFDQPQLTWTTDGANAGTVFLRKGKYNCTNVCGTLKLKSDIQDKISLDYVYHALYVGAPYYKRKDTNGYKIMNNEMAVIKISLPPLDMQEKVSKEIKGKVKIIHDLIVKTNQSIEELKKYKQSLITEAVTKGLDPDVKMKDSGIEWIGDIPEDWKLTRLKFLLKSNLLYGANESGIPYSPSLPRYIRITDIIENNKLTSENKLSLPKEKAENYLLKEGDILFARSGASVGKTFLVESQNINNAFAGYLIKASFKNNVISKFVYYYTLSSAFEVWKGSITIQSTIQNIGADKYNNLPLPIPSKYLQQEIVSYLDEQTSRIDKLIADKTKVIKELESYKKSLIYEYVTGKKEV